MNFLKKLFGLGSSRSDSNPQFNSFVEELISIGRATYHNQKGRPTFYWEAGGKGVKNKRTVEIGWELHRLGGDTIEFMQKAANEVGRKLGGSAMNDLSGQWHKVGWDGTDDEYIEATASLALEITEGKSEVSQALRRKLDNTWLN